MEQEGVMVVDVVFLCVLSGSVSGFILPTTKTEGTDDMSTLKTHVLLLEQNVDVLQRTTAQLRSDLQATMTGLQNTQTQLRTALSDLQTSKTEQGFATDEISSLKNAVNILEGKVKLSADDIASVQTELKSIPHGSSHGDVQLNLTLLDVMRNDVQLNNALMNTLQADVHMIRNNLSSTSLEVAALERNMSDVATTIPNVAFQAHDPPSHTPSASPVKFQLVNYNAGSGYNRYTGKFTVPVSGTYVFWTQLEMGGGSNTALYVYIKKTGGVNMAAGYMETGSSFGDVDASAQTVDRLQKGQEVWVEITTKYEIYHSASYFGGVLLSVG
ncbi:uncharacterized protein [Haliotis asinina]|uniref:uncharacterized protein n=1 Tax=Haliotis asinina TaxID=109174 RepID=UPI003531B1C8